MENNDEKFLKDGDKLFMETSTDQVRFINPCSGHISKHPKQKFILQTKKQSLSFILHAALSAIIKGFKMAKAKKKVKKVTKKGKC